MKRTGSESRTHRKMSHKIYLSCWKVLRLRVQGPLGCLLCGHKAAELKKLPECFVCVSVTEQTFALSPLHLQDILICASLFPLFLFLYFYLSFLTILDVYLGHVSPGLEDLACSCLSLLSSRGIKEFASPEVYPSVTWRQAVTYFGWQSHVPSEAFPYSELFVCGWPSVDCYGLLLFNQQQLPWLLFSFIKGWEASHEVYSTSELGNVLSSIMQNILSIIVLIFGEGDSEFTSNSPPLYRSYLYIFYSIWNHHDLL